MKNDNWSNDIWPTMTTPQLGRSIGHTQNSNISEYNPINLGLVDLTKCRIWNNVARRIDEANIVRFVEQKLMLSSSFRCDQICNRQRCDFGHTLLLCLRLYLAVQQAQLFSLWVESYPIWRLCTTLFSYITTKDVYRPETNQIPLVTLKINGDNWRFSSLRTNVLNVYKT